MTTTTASSPNGGGPPSLRTDAQGRMVRLAFEKRLAPEVGVDQNGNIYPIHPAKERYAELQRGRLVDARNLAHLAYKKADGTELMTFPETLEDRYRVWLTILNHEIAIGLILDDGSLPSLANGQGEAQQQQGAAQMQNTQQNAFQGQPMNGAQQGFNGNPQGGQQQAQAPAAATAQQAAQVGEQQATGGTKKRRAAGAAVATPPPPPPSNPSDQNVTFNGQQGAPMNTNNGFQGNGQQNGFQGANGGGGQQFNGAGFQGNGQMNNGQQFNGAQQNGGQQGFQGNGQGQAGFAGGGQQQGFNAGGQAFNAGNTAAAPINNGQQAAVPTAAGPDQALHAKVDALTQQVSNLTAALQQVTTQNLQILTVCHHIYLTTPALQNRTQADTLGAFQQYLQQFMGSPSGN